MLTAGYFVGFLIQHEFSRQIFENTLISNSMKIRPIGAELSVRTDRHDEANRRFSQFFQRTWKTINEITLVAASTFHEYEGKWPVSFQTKVL
jgi:hypothetical protein